MMTAYRSSVVAMTELIVETFRLNGALLEAGDALVAPLGLTSARWQVLGAIATAQVPLPVAHLARNMGLSRQAVQRLVNEMERDRLVRLAPNPHHKRAKLVVMSDKGRAAFDAAMARQRPWAAKLARGVSAGDLTSAVSLLRLVRERLEKE